MNWHKFTIYFAAPLLFVLTLVLMYFSGVEWLQNIVAPRIAGRSATTTREFGLLENAQNLLLLAMIAVCIAGALKQRTHIERAMLVAIALFSVFVFLEEIDYGLHYYEYINDIPWTDTREVRNWHNQGDRTDQTKRVVDIGMVVLFLIAPVALMKSKSPRVRFFTPDVYSALTLLASFAIRTVAHQLEERGVGEAGVIHKNLSEFREVITYYVFLLYVIELSLRRRLKPTAVPQAAEVKV